MSLHSKIPVSAFIITFNEEDRISIAIESVRHWVDEVIVVDSGSTDNTVKIAEELGAKVVFNIWDGYGKQKRTAEDQCKNQWLLNIDADEEITEALSEEMISLFSPVPKHDIFKVHIQDVFPHETKAKKWAYGYWQFRLYDRNKGRFSASSVHDTVRPEDHARIANLKGKVHHRSQRSLQWAVEKCNRYSDMQVQDMIEKNRFISPIRILTEFPVAFFKSYIVRRGFLYGWWGLVNAHVFAFTRFIRVAKSYEKYLERTVRK